MNRIYNIVFITLLCVTFFSCSKFQKALKSNDSELKLNMANKYYAKEDYQRSMQLYEDIIPVYRGSKQAPEVFWKYTYSNYYLGNYYMAAYYFKKYYKTFVSDSNSKKALFMSAYCNYLLSPRMELDQNDSKKAIEKLQVFVNAYPKSNLVDSCNILMDELRNKIEEKAFKNAALYYKIEHYKAAIVSLDDFLDEYPESKYKKKALYDILSASYIVAKKSIKEKKPKRIKAAIDAYYKFVDNFANSDLIKNAENIYEKTLRVKEEFELKNN